MVSDLLLTERVRVLNRLTSTAALYFGYKRMLEAEDLSANEQAFVNCEIAILREEMDSLGRRLQQLHQPQPEPPLAVQ